MDWIRSSLNPHHEPHREPDVDTVDATPAFRIVDAKNRVHGLHPHASTTTTSASPSTMSSASTSFSSASTSFSSTAMLMPMSARPLTMSSSSHHHYQQDGDADMMDDDEAQLMQQLAFQREEMQFTRPLPRITPPPSHPFPSQCAQQSRSLSQSNNTRPPSLFTQQQSSSPHAFSYSDATSSPLHRPLHPLTTPPTVPPVSPFAGLALSAPAKSSIGAKPPVNPFSTAGLLSAPPSSIENSPRLPSLDAFRAGSPRNLKMGIASRPPALSLRSTSVGAGGFAESPHLGPSVSSFASTVMSTPLPSLSSSMPSPHHAMTSPFSQSLPGMSFLKERLSRQQSFDGDDSLANGGGGGSGSDDDERDSAMLMMRLSSSVPTEDGLLAAELANGQRSGRVCRYNDCNNIARSRGLCRTHGGGKRCSQPGCDKSAQANRKCIAHGGGTPCSFEDCEKTAQSRGLCKAHGGGARCKHPNCPKSSQSKGLCRGHGGGIKCKEDGCEKWVQKNGYCIKHGRERAMTQ